MMTHNCTNSIKSIMTCLNCRHFHHNLILCIIFKSTTKVKVDRETGNAGNTLTVKGYNVGGHVLSDGEPIKGVHFLLFSEDTKAKVWYELIIYFKILFQKQN